MLSYRDIQRSIEQTGIDTTRPVLLHVTDAACEQVRGGAETLAGALTGIFSRSLTPAFTFSAMVIPQTGPENNGLVYGAHPESSLEAAIFSPTLPVDPELGTFAEKYRLIQDAQRSLHPLLSFAGINVTEALAEQSYQKPLAPLASILAENAYILMLGSSHQQNTSIHLAEEMAGRKAFTRWALTPQSIVECPSMPGCSNGFEAVDFELSRMEIRTGFGDVTMKIYLMKEIVETVRQKIIHDQAAYLCEDPGCLCCNAVRDDIQRRGLA